jgi:hypothetical protein
MEQEAANVLDHTYADVEDADLMLCQPFPRLLVLLIELLL